MEVLTMSIAATGRAAAARTKNSEIPRPVIPQISRAAGYFEPSVTQVDTLTVNHAD